MQTFAKAQRKVLSQYITIYQSILEFSLEKMGLEVIVKHNKADPDDMLDVINSKLIEVCEEYLRDKKLPLDKFQLATVCLDLYTKAISEVDEPFKVIAKESKQLVKDYLDSNKSKREALERIKKENDKLDEDIVAMNKAMKEKKQKKQSVINDVEEEEPQEEIIKEKKPQPQKKSKLKYRGTGTADLLADDFIFPKL